MDTEDLNQSKMVYTNANYNNQYIENCGFQSDLNYQNDTSYGNNYGNHDMNYPQARSLENSRQNSYEKDERQYSDINSYYNDQYQEYSPTYDNGEVEVNNCEYDNEALFYNSRPMR